MRQEVITIDDPERIALQQQFRALEPQEKAWCIYAVAAHTLNPLPRKKTAEPYLYGRVCDAESLSSSTMEFLAKINTHNPQVFCDPVWNEDYVTQEARSIIGPFARRNTAHLLYGLLENKGNRLFQRALRQALNKANALIPYSGHRIFYSVPVDDETIPEMVQTLLCVNAPEEIACAGIFLGALDPTTYRVERKSKETRVSFTLDDNHLIRVMERIERYR